LGNILLKRELTIDIAVILLFVGLAFVPGIYAYNKSSFINTIYVDDDNIEGPWDGTQECPYQHIQDAINVATDGDTVFVYAGTYYENVIMNKSIVLVGEDKNSTIIDGNMSGNAVYVSVDWVNISGFTITNGDFGDDVGQNNWFYAGIRLTASNSTINGNIICHNRLGIFGKKATDITIFDNTFIGDGITFSLYDTETESVPFCEKYFIHNIYNNMINGNILYYYKNQQDFIVPEDAGQIIAVNCKNMIICDEILVNADSGCMLVNCSNCLIKRSNISLGDGMLWLIHSNNNTIQYNRILNNFEGICLDCESTKNIVQYNDISNNDACGIIVEDNSNYNVIYKNNLMNNRYQAGFLFCHANKWRQNYWDESRFLPYLIPGKISIWNKEINWINFDWRPAREPYDIRVLLEVGPYTQNVTNNSITIVWESSIPTINNRVKYGENTSYGYVEYGSSDTIHHEITISPPFTSGHYKVVSDGMESGDFEFRLASHCYNTQEFKCVIFGDSRGTWDNYVHATEVANAVNAESPNFAIHGGDMVDDGRVQIQWDSWLALMRPLMQNSTLFGVIGNHERKCGRYYEIFSLPNNEMWYSFDYGPCHFTILDNYEPWNVGSSQYEWLEDDLSSTDLPFKFVCFHEPIYCSGGHSPRTDVRAVWEPIFNNYNVTLVFQSHCHYYQRTNDINGTIYIVSGGAGAPLYTPNDAWFVNNSQKTYHYCVLDVSLATMEITFSARYVNGTTFDEFIVCPPVVSYE